MVVRGYLNISFSGIDKLPDDLVVGSGLYMKCSRIDRLPDGLIISGSLDVSFTKIDKLPNDLIVCESLYINNTNINKLPDGLFINGNLDINNTNIDRLPKDLIINGYLDIDNTNIDKIPNDLIVGEDIYYNEFDNKNNYCKDKWNKIHKSYQEWEINLNKNNKEAELKLKKEQKYYFEHFEEIIVDKIDKKEELNKKELRTLRNFEIEQNLKNNKASNESFCSIIKMCNRYFCLIWQQGLTNCQENDFYNQLYEVKKKTYTKTITVTEWERI